MSPHIESNRGMDGYKDTQRDTEIEIERERDRDRGQKVTWLCVSSCFSDGRWLRWSGEGEVARWVERTAGLRSKPCCTAHALGLGDLEGLLGLLDHERKGDWS